MALDMTEEQREIGKANFHRAVGGMAQVPESPRRLGMTRRKFMKGLMAAGATLPIGAGAYFGYRQLGGNPVRAGLIGAGDEGGVLLGEHNPEFVRFVAVSDIRPYNQKRIFDGEPQPSRPGALWRKGLKRIYGPNAQRDIRLYENYQEMLRDPDIEMVVIALPLNLHAQATIDALRAGKHVLCEKLMAWNIRQCKQMIQAAREADKLLAIGHQRHYSLLYAQANELLRTNVLGEIKHIRALWHRNSTARDGWRPDIRREDEVLRNRDLRPYGFDSLEQLVRWRLYRKTGGGLMAELGSHQLDACSIFLGKVKPIAVTGVGGKFYFKDDREVEDHVFCTFEFPGKNYDPRKPIRDPQRGGLPDYNDVVAVTYSSVSTNGFEKYGECVMGSKATLVVEEELNAMLFPAAGRSTSVGISVTRSGQAVLESSATGPGEPTSGQLLGQAALGPTISRGYREEMEHLAYCIRMRDQGMSRDREDLIPRCHGKAAMADAILALAANEAMRSQTRIVFDERWFDDRSDVVPEWDPRG